MKKMTTVPMMLVLGMIAFTSVGCGPYKVDHYQDFGPSMSIVAVPTEGDSTQQKKVDSVAFLEKNLQQNKRIYLPLTKVTTGRGPGAFRYDETVRLLAVDRALVSRDWTNDTNTGTSANSEAFAVESKDSINFTVGATITCRIEEQNVAKYLAKYADKTLAQVMDSNIHGECQRLLAKEFGVLELQDCKRQKVEIFDRTFLAIKDKFAEVGITVEFFGNIGGLGYEKKEIQTAIDANFIQEIVSQTEGLRKLAQDERNKIDVSVAEAEAQAAKELFVAQEAQELKVSLDTMLKLAQARLNAAKSWNGKLPTGMMPADSPLLFGLQKPNEVTGLQDLVSPQSEKE